MTLGTISATSTEHRMSVLDRQDLDSKRINSIFDTSISESACSQIVRTQSPDELLARQKSFNSEDFSYKPFGGSLEGGRGMGVGDRGS